MTNLDNESEFDVYGSNVADCWFDRTPDEENLLINFRNIVSARRQYQVWHYGDLSATRLTLEGAYEVAERLYPEYPSRLAPVTDMVPQQRSLQVKARDTRWMTANTFIVEVIVG